MSVCNQQDKNNARGILPKILIIDIIEKEEKLKLLNEC